MVLLIKATAVFLLLALTGGGGEADEEEEEPVEAVEDVMGEFVNLVMNRSLELGLSSMLIKFSSNSCCILLEDCCSLIDLDERFECWLDAIVCLDTETEL